MSRLPDPLEAIAARYGGSVAEIAVMTFESSAGIRLDGVTVGTLVDAIEAWLGRGAAERPALPVEVRLASAQPAIRRALARVVAPRRVSRPLASQRSGRRRPMAVFQNCAGGAKYGLLAAMDGRPVGGAGILVLEAILGERLDVAAAISAAEALASWAAAGAPSREGAH